jgi:methylmalonyl-CoA mutase N-terminal domain/subunit
MHLDPKTWPVVPSLSGLPIRLHYGPEDVKAPPPPPGTYPYTRGIHATMYRQRLWTIRQFAGFGTAQDTNRRFRYLLEQGQTGLSVAFDMPTLMGLDSDHPLAAGEVGREGVAVSTMEDMAALFADIPLDQVSVSMTINGPAPVLWAMYLVLAERRGIPWDQLRGTLQTDILKEYIAQKEWLVPPEPSMRIVTDMFAFSPQVPRFNPISVSGYHIREAGATAVQELAFTLADGFAYVEAGMAAGLDVDSFAPKISFFFNSHIDFFEEIAKFRAARRIWAKRLRERYGAKDERSWKLRFHTQTAGSSLTAQQPENNIVRTAFEALAAVLGGTQSLHTNSMDEVLALPTEKAVTVALRTQQIIAHETGVTNTVDPLAGSYFVESLTDAMEAEAERYFAEIEEQGGVLACIENGYFQREIADAAWAFQQQVDRRERIVVGVNQFVDPDEPPLADILRIDPRLEEEQVARVAAFKARRDTARAEAALGAVEDACRAGLPLMPAIVDAVRADATLGEVCRCLQRVFGTWRERPVF